MPDRLRNISMMPIKGTFNPDKQLEAQNEKWAEIHPQEMLWNISQADFGRVKLSVNKRMLEEAGILENHEDFKLIYQAGGLSAEDLSGNNKPRSKHTISPERFLARILKLADQYIAAHGQLPETGDVETGWAGKSDKAATFRARTSQQAASLSRG